MPKETRAKRATGKRGTKKDPNAPKRALSAYMFFANDQREVVRGENPTASFGQIGKLLGEKWKSLTESEKKPYEDKAAEDKKRYEEEKHAYQSSKAELDEED